MRAPAMPKQCETENVATASLAGAGAATAGAPGSMRERARG